MHTEWQYVDQKSPRNSGLGEIIHSISSHVDEWIVLVLFSIIAIGNFEDYRACLSVEKMNLFRIVFARC